MLLSNCEAPASDPAAKPGLGDECVPGEYGCDCDCSNGVVCVCDAPFTCQSPEDFCTVEVLQEDESYPAR